MLKKTISYIVWILFFLSFAITSVVAVAQNSLPGDKTYPIKKTFEKVVLKVYQLLNNETKYQLELTKVRYKEVKQTLNSEKAYSTINDFNLQMLMTYQSIEKTNDQKSKSIYTSEFIKDLKDINEELESQKKIVLNQTDSNQYQTIVSNQSNNSNNNNIVPQINKTQEQISQIINNLEQTTSNNNSNQTIEPTPTIKNQDQNSSDSPKEPPKVTSPDQIITPTPFFNHTHKKDKKNNNSNNNGNSNTSSDGENNEN